MIMCFCKVLLGMYLIELGIFVYSFFCQAVTPPPFPVFVTLMDSPFAVCAEPVSVSPAEFFQMIVSLYSHIKSTTSDLVVLFCILITGLGTGSVKETIKQIWAFSL